MSFEAPDPNTPPPVAPPVASPAYPPPSASPAYPPPTSGPAYPPPYGVPPAAPAATPRTSSYAIAALALSITSFVICPLLFAIVALVLASSAKREIASSNGWVSGDGMVKAAKIISWVNIALGALGLIAILVILSSTGGSTGA